jgi:Ser/Thr protein kinase RdoA (MazF antagonist)
VLQKFNDKVFVRPDVVETNIQLTAGYLKKHHPEYRFVAPIALKDGRTLAYDEHGSPWRMFDYVTGSFSIDEASTVDQAFKVAAAFGRLGRLLRDCPTDGFLPTIDRFHDLSLRYEQLLDAMKVADAEKANAAKREIAAAEHHSFLVSEFQSIITEGILRNGIFHNDTKINNVLFDRNSGDVAAVVDLDTLMPGYFIYDLGDLVRTIVSPVSEEEADLTKVEFRSQYYDAVIGGYLSEMKAALSKDELNYLPFSGQMMTYIMALRFLADFLRGDTYYHTTYPGQNLVRAKNQFRLLALLVEHSSRNK